MPKKEKRMRHQTLRLLFISHRISLSCYIVYSRKTISYVKNNKRYPLKVHCINLHFQSFDQQTSLLVPLYHMPLLCFGNKFDQQISLPFLCIMCHYYVSEPNWTNKNLCNSFSLRSDCLPLILQHSAWYFTSKTDKISKFDYLPIRSVSHYFPVLFVHIPSQRTFLKPE